MKRLMTLAIMLPIILAFSSCGPATQETRLADRREAVSEIKQDSAIKTESKPVASASSNSVWAPASMEKDEMESIKKLVSKASAFLENNGLRATFAQVDDPAGIFTDDKLFIFIINEDRSGKVVASSDKSLLNKNIKVKDDDGKQFIKGILKQAKERNSGYATYKWQNKIRSCYFEKYNKFIIIGSN